MKFYYWKQWLVMLFLAGAISMVVTSKSAQPVDVEPLKSHLDGAKKSNENMEDLLREHSQEVPRYYRGESQTRIRTLESRLNDELTRQNRELLAIAMAATAAVQAAQERSNSGLSDAELVGLLVAFFGTLSTVVLSWRKDIREVRLEQKGTKEDAPRRALP